MTTRGVVIEHARVARHDGVVAQSLAFSDGRVVDESAEWLRVNLRDHVIFPGLINAHDHLQLNAIPSLSHAAPFANSCEWIDAFEKFRATPGVDAAVAVPKETRYRHGGLKNLIAGVTTVAHHDPWTDVFEHDFPVTVVKRVGWSHSLQLGARRTDGDTRYGPEVRESFRSTAADEPWIIHLAEGTDDAAQAELSCLDAIGCLAPNTVIVHGTALTEDDIARVIDRGASVVWCPSSNLSMFGRTLDPRRLAAARRLAIGTDSRLTGARDLLDELGIAAAEGGFSGRELLRMVTTDTARILRLRDESLERGDAAECLILHASGDPYDALLASHRRDVRAVVRNGVPAIADPDFADWFAACGVPTCAVVLDGRDKLMAANLARPDVIALEPGLELAPGDA